MKKNASKSGNNRRTTHNGKRSQLPPPTRDTCGIVDYRLEKPSFEVVEVDRNGEVCYEVRGDLKQPVPPIRGSKYLSPKQCVEIYRWMLLNRRTETALENL